MNQRIRTLVVDDEPYSREELIYLLRQYETIEVIGEASSGEKCIIQATQTQPDLLFLDIEMPGMQGTKVAEILAELKKPPYIVFATAYPQFAVQAFRLEAVDYLLKPYDEEQLAETIARIDKKFIKSTNSFNQTLVNKLAIEMDGEFLYLDPNNILYINSEDKQVNVITKQGKFHTKGTLKDLETKLSAYPFFRTHKSYLVNLDHVRRLTPWFNGAYNLIINGREEPLPVSRNYVKSLRERLEL
ncbi:response regulator transcription factor [Lentibacillus cibarius]|uniref:Response regulator transcription factor n=1 Tax=Lentibacillus cibarius TaxID=2583219 RepID=A0A549YIF2_9BACI|nr:LytTR family DNA-binding domain-containing protein [Lentibacillus cibarius]TRM11656.1 response regulator transcription factor [Lentibacillus cibarius]